MRHAEADSSHRHQRRGKRGDHITTCELQTGSLGEPWYNGVIIYSAYIPHSLYFLVIVVVPSLPRNSDLEISPDMSSSSELHINGNGSSQHEHILRPRAVKNQNPVVVRALSGEDFLSANGAKGPGENGGSTAPSRQACSPSPLTAS